MLRRAGYLAVTIALLVTGALPVAWAASSRIQQARVRKIRACVLRIPSLGEPVPANGPTNPYAGATTSDPDAVDNLRSPGRNQLLFYVLDQRSDLKPDGWEFTNPAAPPYATLEIAQRYGIAQGTAIKPSMAPYWELTLSEANYSYLADMDVIYIPICRRDQSNSTQPETPYPTFFTEEQRRVLTKLADSGVTIWVDWAVNSPTLGGALGGNEQSGATPAGHNKNPFFTNLDFFSSSNAVALGSPPPPNDLVKHPLLAGVYTFQPGEELNIGSAWNPNDPRPSLGRVLELRAVDMQPTCNFAAVVRTSIAANNPQDGAYIAAGRMGAGYVVGTAGNVGGALGSVAGAEIEDLKFAYNVCAWSGEVTAQQKNGRHTAQSSSQINGMIEQWTYPNLVQQPSGLFESYPPRAMNVNQLPVNMVPPLIIDNVVVSTNLYRDGSGALKSEINTFEVRPEDDFDSNNYTDDPLTASAPANDGLADISVGQNYDRVMGVNPPGAIYGMIAGEIPEAGLPQGAKAYIFAAGPGGLFSLPAPRPGLPPSDYWSGSNLKTAPSIGVAYNAAPGFAILPGANGYTRPELYAGGVLSSNPIFGSAYNGRVAAFPVGAAGDLSQGPNWYYPPTQESNRLGLISGPIVTANVVDKGTGAIDTMVLVTSCASGDTTGKVEGFIVATRGDVLTFPKNTGNPNANNINSGRRFVCARWIDIPPGQGQVPQARELMWDPSRHYEVRVMDKQRNYVLLRYISEVPGMLNLLPDGTAGQVELPAPPAGFSVPGQPGVWDTSRYVFLADYSPLPQPVDQGGATIRPRFSPQTPYVRGIQQVVLPTGVGGGVSVGPDNRIYYGTGIGYMCSVEWNRGQPKFAWKMRGVAGEFNNGAGQNKNVDLSTALVTPTNSAGAPNYLDDYAFVSSPAAGKRIVFASRRTGTVYVMEPNASISFKLIPLASDLVPNPMTGIRNWPLTAVTAQNIMLAADHGIGYNSNSPFIRANQQPWGRLPNQFSVDPDTGTVTFLNMENFSLDLSLAASPDQLMALGIDTGGKPAVPIQWKFVGEMGNGRTAWIPLPVVAVYKPVNTEHWISGPVISGDRIYLMGPSGMMHEFPLDPKTVDPAFPRRGTGVAGLDGHNVGNTTLYPPNGLVRTRNITVGTGIPTVAPPAISDKFVAVCTPRGLTAYAAPNVLVADSNRIVEATGDATAVASADVVVKHRINLSEFAIPTDPPAALLAGNPVILTERQFLSRPAGVRKLTRAGSLTSLFNSSNGTVPPVDSPTGIKETSPLADESYLTVDTGNNRIVEFNPGGKVVGEWAAFQDPFNMLPPGETTKLSAPMDVQRWVETETVGGATIYVLHTLIADTGNTRVIELVDKIQYQQGNFTSGSFVTIPGQVGSDGQPVRWYHVLVWSSQTNAQGLKLRYRTAQRIFWPDANGNLMPIPSSGMAPSAPPYLPDERYLSYTMATVQGQTIQYPSQGLTVNGYHQYYASPPASVIDRIPQARPGGDSIVFLRGRYKIDESTGGTPTAVTAATMGATFSVREAKPGSPSNAEKYRFAQGVIDPNVPIITEISDELLANGSPASNNPVHRINGVASVQRTIRTDIKFAPWTYTASVPPRYPYFLIADVDGVWECRMLPGTGGNRAQYCLTMAFTNEDYAYVTGAGNGDPNRLYSTSGADHTPGGRRFSAASARRMPNGLILITSRTGANELPPGGTTSANTHWHVGADVFLLRASDYLTASDRANYSLTVPYSRVDVSNPSSPRHTANEHGWQPDQWVQQQFSGVIPPALRGTPSIRWRASEPGNPNQPPTVRTQFTAPGGSNPNELYGSYQPSQPAFADLIY